MTRRRVGSVFAAFAAFALCLAGCAAQKPVAAEKSAPSAQFVLLADADGKVGKIHVGNEAGERTLERDREAVAVSGRGAPGEPRILGEEELKATFGEALAALPPSPARFILYFQPSSDQLTVESVLMIGQVAAAIRQRVNPDVSIAGHTDTVGSAEANVKLSTERAKTVAGLIAAKGIDTSGYQIVSHGKNNPLVATGDGVAEPRNRRVEVIVR